jgi:hypothetical protein
MNSLYIYFILLILLIVVSNKREEEFDGDLDVNYFLMSNYFWEMVGWLLGN